MAPSSLKTSGSSLVTCQQAEGTQVEGGPGGVTWPEARGKDLTLTLTPIHPIGQNPPSRPHLSPTGLIACPGEKENAF